MLMKNALTMKITPLGKESYSVDVNVTRVGCSRHAARNIESTNEFLDGIRTKGYQVHPAAGICFRSRYLITNEREIEVQGPQTSGEVEFVAVVHKGDLFISVGSDHNDRSLGELWTAMLGRVYDTAKSKQLAPAVVARKAWPYSDVHGHWDDIVLKSYVTISGRREPYQEYRLADLLDLEYYLARCPWLKVDGSVLLGGSGGILSSVPHEVYQGQSSLNDVIFPCDFHVEMLDPVLNRIIAHAYAVLPLERPGSVSL
jgi:hypothetical protein